MQTVEPESYRKHPLLEFVNVNLTRHALHEDVPDVTQNGFCGKKHQDGKYEGTNGISQLPPYIILQIMCSSNTTILPVKQHLCKDVGMGVAVFVLYE